MEYCFGLKALGVCSEYFLFQYSVYNLGAGLATIAIILVLVQFLNPLYQLRLQFRKKLKIFGITLFILNILTVFVAAIVPFIPGSYLPLISYPIFWEILGGLLFLASLTVLLYAGLKKITYVKNEKFLAKLYSLVIRYVAEGTEKHTALAKELVSFSESLFDVFHKKNVNMIPYANSILMAFSDPEFCKLIAIKEPRAFSAIIKGYRTVPEHIRITSGLIGQLIYQSLINGNSIISRELTRDGLGSINRGKGALLPYLLKEYSIIGHHRPFSWFNLYKQKHDVIYMENFIEFWRRMLDTFFESSSNLRYSDSLLDGFQAINSFVSQEKELGTTVSITLWTTHLNDLINKNVKNIMDFYGNSIPEIPTNTYGGETDHYDKFKDDNFFGIIAQGVYLLLEPSKKISGWTDKRHYFNSVYNVIDMGPGNSIKENEVLAAIQNRLEFMFEEQIRENLKGWYPMILRVFFEIFGYQIFTNPKDATNFYKKILKLVAEKLPLYADGYIWNYPKTTKGKVLQKNKQEAKKTIAKMFPKNMQYDRKTNSLTYMYSMERSGIKIYLDKFLKNKKIETEEIEC